MVLMDGFQAQEIQWYLRTPPFMYIRHLQNVNLLRRGEFRHVIYWGVGPAGHAFAVCPCALAYEQTGGPCWEEAICTSKDPWEELSKW